MKKAVFRSIMALALVLGLTLAMATPVVAENFPETYKDVVWDAADGHPEGVYIVGQDIVYSLRVTNDTTYIFEVEYIRDVFAVGTDALEDSAWDNIDGIWIPWDSEDPPPTFSIASGGNWSQLVTHEIPDVDDTATITNQILVRGETNELYTANLFETVQVIKPEIELEKIVTPGVAQVGQTVTYTFTITNTGDWPLEDISLIDNVLGDLTDELPVDLVLAAYDDPGYYHSFTYTYTIQAEDLPLTNTATVTAIAEGFDGETFGLEASPTAVVEDSDTVTVTSEAPPVGGTAHPVSRLALLVPWIVLAGLIAGAAVFVWSRRAQGRA